MLTPFKNTVLVVVFNFSKCVQNMQFLQELYGPHFKHVLFYSDIPSVENTTNVQYVNIGQGFYTERVFPHLYANFKNLLDDCDGLLYTMDDNIINVNLLSCYTPDKIIFKQTELKPIHEYKGWWWDYYCGIPAVKALLADNEFQAFQQSGFTKGALSDMFYLPKRYLTKHLFDLFELYGKHGVFLEIAIPSIIMNLKAGAKDFHNYNEFITWGEERLFVYDKERFYTAFQTNLCLHPIKMTAQPHTAEWIRDIVAKPKGRFFYMIQTSGSFPDILSCLKHKDHALLSYKENTADTTIFFPKSTWTTGRNKLREYAMALKEKYDYYIFLDEDVLFDGIPQEVGFFRFEQLLMEHSPYIGNPLLRGYGEYKPIEGCEVQTTVWYDGIFNAFSHEAFFSSSIFPYISKYDNDSWWTSQYIMILLCSAQNKDVYLFNNLAIINANHTSYPRGFHIFKTAEKDVFETILMKPVNSDWDHARTKIIKIKPAPKKCIVITTINAPTKQVIHYANMSGWDLIVVGDSKTDNSLYKALPCIYLGLEEQKEQFPTLYDKIPLRSYTRKMFGYLYAIRKGYSIIYDTDDDNQYTEDINSFQNNFTPLDSIDIPAGDIKCIIVEKYDTFEFNKHMLACGAKGFTFNKADNRLYLKHTITQKNGHHPTTISARTRPSKSCNTPGFVNLYKIYTDEHIWPRGIPPNHSSVNIVPELVDTLPKMECAIIQGLVNNDPDVDAHYRINISDKPFNFTKAQEFDVVLDKYSVCPFNTQNTFWTDPATFYAMYLPVTVTFRYTDILHGFVALYQLWKQNKTIKFTYPTAVQERNVHDLNKDYESEVPMYETAEEVIRLLNENKDATIQEMYAVLAKHNIVTETELDVLNEWMRLVETRE